MTWHRLLVIVLTAVLMIVSSGCSALDRTAPASDDGTLPTATPGRSASATEVSPSVAGSPAPPTSSTGEGILATSAPPTATFPATPAGLPLVVRSGPATRRRVALTFDADMTPAMLRRLQTGEIRSYHNAALIDELRRRKVPATLFLTGLWMQRYPDVTRELAADPLFELGTHTWSHRAFTATCYGLPTAPRSQMLQEVTRAQRLLDDLAGSRSTKLFRFPGGCYNTHALRAVAPAGVTAVQFDVEGGDGFQPRPAPIVRAVTQGTRNGSIVVLHMNGANTSPRTADAIGPIVKRLRAQGYTLTTVSGLFQNAQADRPRH